MRDKVKIIKNNVSVCACASSHKDQQKDSEREQRGEGAIARPKGQLFIKSNEFEPFMRADAHMPHEALF